MAPRRLCLRIDDELTAHSRFVHAPARSLGKKAACVSSWRGRSGDKVRKLVAEVDPVEATVDHLACHGLVDPTRPLLSSLALAPGGQDDGFLTVLEVFRMKLPADLVVLSAARPPAEKCKRAGLHR